jgi:hypothetical protein
MNYGTCYSVVKRGTSGDSADTSFRSNGWLQCGQTGGPRATSSPRLLVTRPAKLSVNLLPVTTSSFILFTPKDLKKIVTSRLLLYVRAPHIILRVFQVKIMSDTSGCRSKFKIICNSSVICAHFNTIYIWAYAMVMCNFWASTAKDNENWLLVF